MKHSELLRKATTYLSTSQDLVNNTRVVDGRYKSRYICNAINFAAKHTTLRLEDSSPEKLSVFETQDELKLQVLEHIRGYSTFEHWFRITQQDQYAPTDAHSLKYDQIVQDARHKWVDDTIKELQEQGQ